MKKLVYVFIILFLFVPTMVFADSSSPSILGYDAVIINKNGVKVDVGEENMYTIPYNTKVHVTYEYDNSASCEVVNKKDGLPDGYFDVPLKDISPVKEEVVPKDLEKVNNQGSTLAKGKGEFIVINTKGAKLRKGPADIYGKYDKVIAYETKLHTTHYIQAEGYSSWCYVDDNGYKGWVEVDDDFAIYKKGDYLTFNSVGLKDKDGNTISTIPSETKFTEIYKGSGVLYLKYNGKSGIVKISDSFDIGYKADDETFLTVGKTNIISMDGKSRGTIPASKIVKILYSSPGEGIGDVGRPIGVSINEKPYFYVEYNGIKGFVKEGDVYPLYFGANPENDKAELLKEKDFYNAKIFVEGISEDDTIDNYFSGLKKIKTIPKGASVKIVLKDGLVDSKGHDVDLYLIEYKGELGCIITEDDDNGNNDDFKYISSSTSDPTSEPTETPEPTTAPSTPEATIEPEKPSPSATEKSDNMILYCIIGGVVLAITAIATIIAINKKKKKEQNIFVSEENNITRENTEENKEEKKILEPQETINNDEKE